MKSFFEKEIISHPIIISAMGAVVVIAVASGIYYFVSTRSPSSQWATASVGSITETVTGSGTVEPAQNPDLAFISGGRVVAVNVAVGDTAYTGQVLASLDTAALAAQEDEAEANVKAQQAKLDEMNAGATPTEIQQGQTAVAQAQQSLANTYANVPASLTNAYNQAYNGVRQDTDSLFSQPTSGQPTIIFQTTDSQSATNAASARLSLNAQLPQWQTQVNALANTSDQASIDASLTYSITQLMAVRTYTSTLLQALANAIPSGSFGAASIAQAQTSVSALNTTVSSLILSLQGAQQGIASGKLAVQSAQDALNTIEAGSTSQDIEAQTAQIQAAQAQVASIQAEVADDVVVAPFSGKVTSVAVKSGQSVAPGTVAVSLTPESALQVELYVSEVDVAKLKVGDTAQVTLDAYGTGRVFTATVASIDGSPTMQNGTSAYKVVLQFASNDPAIASGMTANATIVAAQKQNVIVIPRSAVLQNGSQTFVLVPSPNNSGSVEKEIQTGAESDTNVEVVSGLSAGDQYLVNTK